MEGTLQAKRGGAMVLAAAAAAAVANGRLTTPEPVCIPPTNATVTMMYRRWKYRPDSMCRSAVWAAATVCWLTHAFADTAACQQLRPASRHKPSLKSILP